MTFLALLDLFALPRFRRPAVSDYASEVAQALRAVTGGLCMCAVSGLAKGIDDQIELAAEAFKHCDDGFANINVSDEASKRVIEAIQSCAKGKRR